MTAVQRLPERIEADGILLRRWARQDAEVQAHAIGESIEHLRPWMPWVAQEPLSLEMRRLMIGNWERDWEAGGDVFLAIWIDGRVAGSCGLHRRIGPDALEIGYWTHPAVLRQGVATKAARMLTGAALAVPGITRAEIHHDKANERSAGIPRKLGYEFVEEREREPTAPGESGLFWIWRMVRSSPE
jgi:ribosomal-protein-serine acetyltransferase